MPRRRALLLVNRKSRQGQNDISAALGVLRDHGFDLVMADAEGPRALVEAVRSHAADIELVILGGGDGTVNCVVDDLVDLGLPLGLLPLGTANDLARTLGIPTLAEDAARVIAGGRQHAIDVGRVNGKAFLNVASVGLSVQVTRRLRRGIKRRWGVLGYALTALKAVLRARAFRAEIRIDGETHLVESVQIAVGNGRHYGGGMTIAEDAAIDDSRLDLYSLAPQPPWRFLRLLPALRAGNLGQWPGVLAVHGRDIEIITRRPLPVNTDGELTTRTPAHFQVQPRALTMIVPHDYVGHRQGGDEECCYATRSRSP